MANAGNVIRFARSGPPPRQVSKPLLLLLLAAPPLAWGLHLVINYAFASQVCFPGWTPRGNAAGVGWLWPLLIAIDLAALAACVAAAVLSLRSWRDAPHDYPLDQELETGEGRSRFLGLWGLLTGAMMFATIFFDFVSLWILPLC